jgi:hypothetical protein
MLSARVEALEAAQRPELFKIGWKRKIAKWLSRKVPQLR